MIELKALDSDNFKDFLSLLKERGEAPEAFYRWKFLEQVYNAFPAGLIAYIDGKAVGCIGNINRIYTDDKGKEHAAIWLCDACISNEVKEKGIGVSLSVFVSLFKYFSSLSTFRFCIPGTDAAQAVMKKTGYFLQKDCYEISVPCRAFQYGFGEHKDNLLKRFARGFRHAVLSPASSHLQGIEIREIRDDFEFHPEPAITRLKRDEDYFRWLYLMPDKTSKSTKKWYKITAENCWLILFIEQDNRNICRARVVDYNDANKIDKSIDLFLAMRPVLAKLNVIYLQVYIHTQSIPLIPKPYFKLVSQYSSFEISLNHHTSYADKESGWIDLYFK